MSLQVLHLDPSGPLVPQLEAVGFDFGWHSLGFPRMARVLPAVASRCGSVRVEHFTIEPDEAVALAIEALQHSDVRRFTPPGRYAKLMVRLSPDDADYVAETRGWCLMMSDSRAERAETARLLEVGRGRVLVLGLGLGMLVHGLANKPGVESVTVVERSRGVIECVGPTLPAKVRIVEGDARSWTPANPDDYDVVLMDIWPYIGETMRDELRAMRAHYTNALPAARIEGWLEREVTLSEDLWDRVLAECRATSDSEVKVDLGRAIGMFAGRWRDVQVEVSAAARGGR